jgi:hypothetical protein
MYIDSPSVARGLRSLETFQDVDVMFIRIDSDNNRAMHDYPCFLSGTPISPWSPTMLTATILLSHIFPHRR